ncbi:MAG: hypothetical protein AAB956_02640 [Patescibacteria group bacterium]
MKIFNSNKGFIATSTVLVLMVVAISIMITVTLLGIGGAQGSLALTKGETTLGLVEGCVETALLNVKNSASYSGGNITLTEGTCTATVNSVVGNVWTITVSTAATDYKRTIRVVFTRSTSILLTSWQEI